MNAIMMRKALLNRVSARPFATATNHVQPRHPLGLRLDKVGFRQGFLQDPSVYPLIAIMGCAFTFVVGMGTHALLTYKDVQVDPKKRNEMFRSWGKQEEASLTKKWTRRATKRMNLTEGLGVDHKEWLKHKKEDH